MKLRYYSALIFIAGLLLLDTAESAPAAFHTPVLDNAASVFANRPVQVECRSVEEDWNLDGAWGYVWIPTGEQGETYIRDTACLGALAIDLDVPEITDYMKSIGAAVLVHESFHLRRVPGNENEAITECRAMRSYDKVLRTLGAEESTISRLIPLMMVQHWRLTTFAPAYYRKACKVPIRYDKWLGNPPRDD